MSNLNFRKSKKTPHYLIVLTLIVITLSTFSHRISAQNNQVVQVKAFSENLSVFPNLNLSINNGEFINLNQKGLAFANLKSTDIPVQSIKLKDETLEVASWNLSKGTLEVIIRKKNYINKEIKIVNTKGEGVPNVAVLFKGEKTIRKQTDAKGSTNIPLALKESIKGINQFVIEGYEIRNLDNKAIAVLTVEKIPSITEPSTVKTFETSTNQNESKNQTGFSIQGLDTINSLKGFYNFLNRIQEEKITDEDQLKLDQKFDELLNERNSIADSNNLLGQISDTTVVENDLEKIFEQVKKDNVSMSQQRKALEEKIQMVIDKLNVDFDNMSEKSKAKLLDDIRDLEEKLKNNKSEFNENLDKYLTVISELKRRFFDLQKLENKLSESERERLKEKKIYQQRLILTLAVAVIFAFLIILLFYFRTRLKRQKKELIEANKVVKLTNENLENIVLERTFLLHKTFKELDTVLYKASHDLRAPLSSIAGISDLIKRETNNNELTGLLFKTNRRMDKLLGKLSTISEIHQAGEFQYFDLNIVTKELINSFRSTIKERKIRFSSKVDVKDQVLSIPKLIEVILYHLLENAFFFSWISNEGEAVVDLKIQIREKNIEIVVSNNGTTIDDSVKNRIFEMFYVGSEHSNGNGLGLYIVLKSIELLNGSVDVASDEKGSTLFSIKLPTDGKGSSTLAFLNSLEP